MTSASHSGGSHQEVYIFILSKSVKRWIGFTFPDDVFGVHGMIPCFIFYGAGINQDEILQSEILHGPGHEAYISGGFWFYKNNVNHNIHFNIKKVIIHLFYKPFEVTLGC